MKNENPAAELGNALSTVYLMDCVEGMRQFADNHFDLAVVDPPYGIGKTWGKSSTGRHDARRKYDNKKWNNAIPSGDYFNELYRVSKHQIIWGCNYYLGHIKNVGRIVWDKKTAQDITSSCDLASQSFTRKIELFAFMWDGYRQQRAEIRIHPTQKPIALYDWIFQKYANKGDLILDTNLGSQSSRIAAHKAKLDFIGFEIESDYYEAGNKRFKDFVSQGVLF